MSIQRVIIVGGFDNEEMIPTLVEGFLDLGLQVDRIPTRGVIEQHRQRDSDFAAKEIIAFPTFREKMHFRSEAEFCAELHDVVAGGPPALILWWYAKDDRPGGLIEALPCPTVRFSWDDPMAIEAYGEDWSRGFTHAVTSCRDSIAHYEQRGIKAMWTLPPVSPTRHGQAVPTPGEECDICFTFFTLYNGEAPYLRERVKRRDLIEAAARLGVRVHVYGRRERFGRGFMGLPEESYRGMKSNMELPGCFAAAKIAVTQHPQIDAAGYVSPRDMEAMASGAFLLSDDAVGFSDMSSHIMLGKYRTIDEFRTWCKRVLDEREWRGMQIMRDGTRGIVLRAYSGKRFAEQLLEFVG